MEPEQALPLGNYNEKIKIGEHPEFWVFPDFILSYEGSTLVEEINVFTGKRKKIVHKFKMKKEKDKRYDLSLDLSRKSLSPVVFDDKQFLFETGTSGSYGELGSDEFIVRLPTQEELAGPQHIHFLG